MFALRAGRHAGLAPIALGSHLDTQPTGGKFDGNLGVLGALEALRTLVAAGYETNARIVVVNWTNEEGARFEPAMLAGRVRRRLQPGQGRRNCRERRVLLGEALEQQSAGAAGDEDGSMPLSAYLELRASVSWRRRTRDFGVVTGVQGVRWYEGIHSAGRESHAGTTPMPRRADPRRLTRLGGGAGDRGTLAPTAVAARRPGPKVEPDSINVIPGMVRMTVRPAPSHPMRCCRTWRTSLHAAIEQITSTTRWEIALKKVQDLAAVKFHPDCIGPTRARARGARPVAPRYHLGRWPRCLPHVGASHADIHDLRALQGRPEPQRGRERRRRALRTQKTPGPLEAALALDAKLGGR